jgi:hypothetical protein
MKRTEAKKTAVTIGVFIMLGKSSEVRTQTSKPWKRCILTQADEVKRQKAGGWVCGAGFRFPLPTPDP